LGEAGRKGRVCVHVCLGVCGWVRGWVRALRHKECGKCLVG
jgi:hypothetical protein